MVQAQKFSTASTDDEELEEEGLLETPLDKVEPYGLFKSSLMSNSHTFIVEQQEH